MFPFLFSFSFPPKFTKLVLPCVNARYCGIVILFRLEYTLWILISKGSLLFKRVFITVVPDLLVVPNPADNLVAHGQH